MSLSVEIVKGLFYLREGKLWVTPSELGLAPYSVELRMEGLQGLQVEAIVSHLPSDPPTLEVPGYGSCLWEGACPCGHREDPYWMYALRLQGVLERCPPGTWSVGGVSLPIQEYLVGHRGQMVICTDALVGELPPSIPSMLQEADSLLNLLKDLQTHLKKKHE